jgi:hypothetical protein
VTIDIIISLLKPLVNNLVNGDYEIIEHTDRSGLYTSEEIKELVDEYSGNLTTPPDEDYKNINIIAVENEP